MDQELLKESMCSGVLHETLLMGYVRTLHEVRTEPGSGGTSDQGLVWLHSIGHMASAYLMTGRVWQQVFNMVKEEESWGSSPEWKEQVLGEVYERWQRADRGEATLAWARWLLEAGKGREASAIVVGSGRMVGLGLEKGWMEIVNQG